MSTYEIFGTIVMLIALFLVGVFVGGLAYQAMGYCECETLTTENSGLEDYTIFSIKIPEGIEENDTLYIYCGNLKVNMLKEEDLQKYSWWQG